MACWYKTNLSGARQSSVYHRPCARIPYPRPSPSESGIGLGDSRLPAVFGLGSFWKTIKTYSSLVMTHYIWVIRDNLRHVPVASRREFDSVPIVDAIPRVILAIMMLIKAEIGSVLHCGTCNINGRLRVLAAVLAVITPRRLIWSGGGVNNQTGKMMTKYLCNPTRQTHVAICSRRWWQWRAMTVTSSSLYFSQI